MHTMGRDNRRRIATLAITLVLALAPAGAGAGLTSPAGAWPAVLAQQTIALPVASGIQYNRLTLETADGPLDIHHLNIDLSNPAVKLGVGLARDHLMSDDEPVSSMVLRSGAIAGINGDYFDIRQSGIPLNIVVRDGVLLRSPWRWVAFAVGKDGTPRIVRYRWTGTISLPETGDTRALDGYNSGLYTNGVVAISDVRGFGAADPGSLVRQTIVELTPAADGGRYFVKQIGTQQALYPPLPANEILLVGLGTGADWLANKMQAGRPVQVNLTTDPDWRDLALAIGGGPLLVQNGEVVEDPDAPAPREWTHSNPVVALGIARDGRSILLVEADGRQPDLSIGLTRLQLAAYLQRLGAFQAMAFDSGGSATMVVRLPGRSLPAVVNSPSDGRERPVADALLIYSTATPGPPARLVVNAGQPLQLFAGARAALSVIGVDANGTPVPLTDPVTATGASGLVTVGGNGTVTAGVGAVVVQSGAAPQGTEHVTAGSTAGTGTLVLQSGPAHGTLPVSIVTRVARLVVAPREVNLDPGAEAQFALRAQDSTGRPVTLPDGGAEWTLRPNWLGTISPAGEFTAGDAAGAGAAVARLGGATVFVRVAVGNAGKYLAQFDKGEWTFRGYPATVSGSTSPAAAPGREGHPAARLEFHLDGSGTRAAFLVTDIALPGEPTGISMWVLGDGSRIWLRGAYAEANGERGTFTFARQVDWQGWRSVSAALPPGLDYPITLVSLYVVEPDPDRSPSGVLYLSSLRALYPADPSR